LAVSDIPFYNLISEVRVARVDGKLVINPSRADLERSDIDMMIGASMDSVAMVEGEMKEISEAEMIEAIKFAHEAIKIQIQAQERLRAAVGSPAYREYEGEVEDEEVYKKVKAASYDKYYAIAQEASAKSERGEKFAAVKEEVKALFSEEEYAENPDLAGLVGKYSYKTQKEAVRNVILEKGIRLDGRKTTEIRPIWCETDYLPSVHGSSLFTRGETQALATVTLGTSREANVIDNASEQGEEKFYLHYNFPPFSTGEAKPLRGTSRREVGHGNLAQRALKNMIPADCPYTIRVVSEVLESNGSSSMATVCAGTMALMDAGVQMIKPVSGIAMGLITDGQKFAVLSDILGDEDHLGDMDFKVTGTREGICGVQMDIKVDGLKMEVMRKALDQARRGRLHILDAMYKCISASREDVKPHAPRMVKLFIDKEFIGAVIGPGGKVIQEIQRETGTTITLEEINNRGEVSIFSVNKEGVDKAVSWIKGIVAVPQIGDTYDAVVKSIMPFGAFVEFLPGKQRLVHISEVSWKRLETLDGLVKEGDAMKVKLIGTDPKSGKFKLSRKALIPKPDQQSPTENES